MPSSARFPSNIDWRFVVVDRRSFATLTFLDKLAFSRTLYYELNQAAYAAGSVSSDNPEVKILHTDGDPFLSYNDRFLFGLRREGANSGGRPPYLDPAVPWVPRFSGLLTQLQRQAPTEAPVSHYTAYDPLQYWDKRPVVNDQGVIPGSDGIARFGKRGDQVLIELLTNSLAAHGSLYVDFGQTAYYGGTIEHTDPIDIVVRGAGGSLAAAVKQITDTQTVDILLTPIYDVNRPGILCELSIFKAPSGRTRNEAIFAWDMPSRSLSGLDLLHDGAEMGNIAAPWLPSANTFLEPVQDNASVSFYGKWFILNQSLGSSIGDSANRVTQTAVQTLLALAQVAMQKAGKNTLTISPTPERSPLLFQEYGIGDSVPVYASDNFGEAINPGNFTSGNWSNPQRVIAIPIDLSDDGVETITSMLMTYNPSNGPLNPPALTSSFAAAVSTSSARSRTTTVVQTSPFKGPH